MSPFPRFSSSKCACPWHSKLVNVKCKYANWKLIVIVALSFTISKIFTCRICMTLTLTFSIGQVQWQYDNWKVTYDFLFGLNVFLSITIFKMFTFEIYTTLTLAFKRAKVQCKNHSRKAYITCYLMAVVTFTTSITISKTFSLKCARPWPLQYARSNVNIPIESKLIHDVLFDGNMYFFPISHNF